MNTRQLERIEFHCSCNQEHTQVVISYQKNNHAPEDYPIDHTYDSHRLSRRSFDRIKNYAYRYSKKNFSVIHRTEITSVFIF